MLKMSYPTRNTPEKEYARRLLYTPEVIARKGLHVCIASAACGDIRLLLKEGVSRARILAHRAPMGVMIF